MQPRRPSSLFINTHSAYCIKNNSEPMRIRSRAEGTRRVLYENTYCAWKSTSTGRSLLMTLSVKSSLSCTLKETHLCEDRGRERGHRKYCLRTAVLRKEEGDEDEEEERESEATGRRRESFTQTDQILLTSSRVAI